MGDEPSTQLVSRLLWQVATALALLAVTVHSHGTKLSDAHELRVMTIAGG